MSHVSLTLISHASVVIEAGGSRILTDPWQFGGVFNNSWSLLVPPADLDAMLESIDYLWISHEHPDHFHIPTLKALPQAFRKRVTVLFQESSDHPKMVSALRDMLGFGKVELLPHRKWVRLTPALEVYCYQSRQLDSALAVRSAGKVVLNLNDCEASRKDLEQLRADLGPVEILLNQFSIAGFDGEKAKLRAAADGIIDNMVRDHRALGATKTVPFASLVYFSCVDNHFINEFANTPRRVAERFAVEGLELAVLLPGERFAPGGEHDSTAALARYDAAFDEVVTRPLAESEVVAFEAMVKAFEQRRARLLDAHGWFGLKLLKPVVVHVPDLEMSVLMSFREGTVVPTDQPADIIINSQPLHFMLANDFGLQTLGVSGRYELVGDLGNWFRHRTLMALVNAGLGLAPRRMLSRAQLRFFWNRRGELVDQIRYRVARVFG